jgi:hypothetical protein
LFRFLVKGNDIIRDSDPLEGSTQANGSFHAVKAMYADKRINFGGSCACRFALAVISHSGGPGWLETLRGSMGLEADPAPWTEQLRRGEAIRRRRNEAGREPEARRKRKRNPYRTKLRGTRAAATAGKEDYHMAAE